MTSHPVSRRTVLAAAGGVAAGAALAGCLSKGAHAARGGRAVPTGGYVGDGVAGLAGAFPLAAVRLLDGPFRANQTRNTDYLHFVDPDRLLYTFRRNVDLPPMAGPCGGWEAPDSEVRGHCTGHLLSALALTYANTADQAAADKGSYLVSQLALCQARSPRMGRNEGYLSAFPETFFDLLEAGRPVWAPYYMIHKIMAGLIDQYELVGNAQALEVAVRLADWVDRRTGRLSYAQMQQVLEDEHGAIAEALANVYRLTGDAKYLRAADRFYHARIFDPLARGTDELAGNHANTTIPKMISCLRLWEETGDSRYHAIAANFWQIVTAHHTYVTGGTSNYEHFQEPDSIAAQLSNLTCENCCSYHMLKLTRLLHFNQPDRVDLLDYYERTLFNQMLGEQDPDSAHGFNIYYTGLSPGAFKQQPRFMGSDPDVYSTDYDNFSCDHATGLETQAKFADTIYSHDRDSLSVNLFIPSEVTWADKGVTLRQTTGFPDEPGTRIEIVSGDAAMVLRVRVPSWVAATPQVRLNGVQLPAAPAPGGWLVLDRRWRTGDQIAVTLPMRLALNPTPDEPSAQAVTYGPIVLSGAYGDRAVAQMPRLDPASPTVTATRPLTFQANADGETVTLVPIARMHHQHYNVYWQT
ncbi:DUF1680 family protein [Streptacidiphilus sp. MAP12-16]|uniref:glycoside hydrolase family 127 protein n=1 Tax=Streptacidiphilus sp. MAP12-16 TaxID=3156300 RepID=UPI003515C4A7